MTAETPVAATQLDLRTRTPGYDVTIYAADKPGETIGDWGRAIGRAKDVGSNARRSRSTPAGRPFKHYLIWITSLPDGNKADIAQVHLLGPS